MRTSSDESAAVEARAEKEAKAYDDGQVWEISSRWHGRVPHVILAPNTLHAEERFRALIAARARGGRVMDVGCGRGVLSAELHAMGASSVYGFDVSQGEVDMAQAEYGELPGVTFGAHGIEAPIAGAFDLIVGRSILHHVDFRRVLPVLFERNLAPGGRMLFMEPMSHPLTLAFHRFVRSAHTPDEWPLTPDDVTWLGERFAADVVPINLLSFPIGILSGLLHPWLSPGNLLMRAADRIDQALEDVTILRARGRQGLIIIDRPATESMG
ncbi:MAG TPA: class I SAM-dependent methyltransferase [Solirubrobacteraceae bacterium]|nr:class I SAM-dependent methyltransferase [Solirubrobacteraceae bacterium]